MIKKVLSTILTLSFILICPLTAFASVATPSDAKRVPVASSSDVNRVYDRFMEDYFETDSFDTVNVPMLISSGDDDITVPWAGVYNRSTGKWVKDVKGTYKSTSNGYKRYTWPEFNDDSLYYHVFFYYVQDDQLPAPGTYGCVFTFAQGNINIRPTSANVMLRSSADNVSYSQKTTTANLTSSNGVFTGTCNVVIDYKTSDFWARIMIPEYLTVVDLLVPVSNPFKFTFDEQAGATATPPSYGSSTPEDAMAEGINQQVEQSNTIIGLIKNTIQTISSQLTAFWNQLAGEFTNLYNKMNAQHAEQLEADRSNTEDIIDAEQANTTNIINNNNQNTEKITNGYDSSALDESNNNLNNKLQEYESAESGITDTAGGWISDFTMPDFDNLINTGGILSACIWLGGFWQSLFTNMGSFNIPVTLSFVLIFVLMLVGYHRFRR